MAGDFVDLTFFSGEKKVNKEKPGHGFLCPSHALTLGDSALGSGGVPPSFFQKKVGLALLLTLFLSGVAFAHTAMNKFWGEVPVDMLLTGDVLIVKPLIVPEGVTLTIDPGTVVRFERSAKGDNRITVRGRLVAAGAKGNVIKFIPKDNSSGPWRGIDFESGGTGRIENCIFEKASKGVTDPGRKVQLKDVSFR